MRGRAAAMLQSGEPIGAALAAVVGFMLAFATLADPFGRRVLFTGYSLLTAVSLCPLAFHWDWLLTRPVRFRGALFGFGLGSGCTAGFGALLAELFPAGIRNFSMGTTYNMARAVQFFAPVVVNQFVVLYGLAGGLSVPLVLARQWRSVFTAGLTIASLVYGPMLGMFFLGVATKAATSRQRSFRLRDPPDARPRPDGEYCA